ncbi:MAG: hypothetical protein AAF514_20575 [Verrucomicrobiota bacterium]
MKKALIEAVLCQGHRVCSPATTDPRFPGGTLQMQMPLFARAGLDLSSFYPGSLNASIAPATFEVKAEAADFTFPLVRWSPTEPPETFSFFRCRVGKTIDDLEDGFVYYPHPETKPEHFQPPGILEIVAPRIDGIQYGDPLFLDIDPVQIRVDRPKP